MDKVKRILLFRIPVSVCNFRCHYCYLAQRPIHFQGERPDIQVSPEEFGEAFSYKRLGGYCYGNFCADGETLLTKGIDSYVKEFCKQGHFAEVVTNLSVTKILERFLEWDGELLKHLEFKCSFHYLWLKEHGLLERFAENVKKIWEAGASATIEITPSDELIPFIDEVKSFSMDHFGALPHLTIARDDRTKEIGYLTHLNMLEYDAVWSQFNSEFWQFKKSIFGVRQTNTCFAGAWSYYIDIVTGEAKACYFGNSFFNFYDKLNGRYLPLSERMVGKCPISHCYNGHALMTLGLIPHKYSTRYGEIRDRCRVDGTHWLQPDLRAFFNTKLEEGNGLCDEFYHYIKYRTRHIRNSFSKRLRKLL